MDFFGFALRSIPRLSNRLGLFSDSDVLGVMSSASLEISIAGAVTDVTSNRDGLRPEGSSLHYLEAQANLPVCFSFSISA